MKSHIRASPLHRLPCYTVSSSKGGDSVFMFMFDFQGRFMGHIQNLLDDPFLLVPLLGVVVSVILLIIVAIRASNSDLLGHMVWIALIALLGNLVFWWLFVLARGGYESSGFEVFLAPCLLSAPIITGIAFTIFTVYHSRKGSLG